MLVTPPPLQIKNSGVSDLLELLSSLAGLRCAARVLVWVFAFRVRTPYGPRQPSVEAPKASLLLSTGAEAKNLWPCNLSANQKLKFGVGARSYAPDGRELDAGCST